MMKRIKQVKNMLLSASLAASILIPYASPEAVKAAEQENLEVHFIDVGQGLSVLVESDDETLLYDGGDREHSSYLVSYLQRNGVKKIDYMVSSHYDSDHLAGLIGVLNAFDVETVIGSEYEHDSKLYQSFYSTVEEQGKEVVYAYAGDTYSVGDAEITVIGPTQIISDSNNNSVAIRLDYENTSFIITGDAEYTEEADILSTGIDLDCDVLVAGHHGSATSSSWDFVEATLPEYVVISCGADNSYGHPHDETLEKFESLDAMIFRTDEQGNIIAVSNGETIEWNTLPSVTYPMYAAVDTLNIREAPNTDCAVLGTYAKGDKLETVAEENGWVTIIYGNELAYVAAEFVTDIEEEAFPEAAAQQEQLQPVQEVQAPQTQPAEITVWLSATGSKYHRINNCGNMNPEKARQISESDAVLQGYEKCKNCW